MPEVLGGTHIYVTATRIHTRIQAHLQALFPITNNRRQASVICFATSEVQPRTLIFRQSFRPNG